MEWTQFQYFQTVAQLQHFTNAAEVLSISQPALSRSIARLEEELGVPLFERQGRTVVLNTYGKIFLNRVKRAIQEITLGQQEIQNLLDPLKGSVSLGFIHSQGSNLVPDLLGLFRQRFPEIQFMLYQNVTHQVLDQLEAGDIDFCFCSQPSVRENIRWIKLLTEEIVLIVPQEHPFARHKTVKLTELAAEAFIAFKKELSLGEIIYQIFAEAGFTPKVTFEGEEVGTVAGLVAAKLGIALIPKVRNAVMGEIAQVHVSEPKCQRVIGMAWVEGRYLSPAARHFKEFVLEHFLNSLDGGRLADKTL
ncbi:LysR family transcriptional regulator [Desulfosporosinus sp. PR]|uniref:LysR family transcriptional regulator n=1 Tax=Candidatus Desulfosporosinus nitrosoreducens TaxID=3401928 RepID=UPI0027F23C5A|nr:LysR family transcriptional regulator [Desulfosporosinus sp. PR]MDQ7092842.1 LysR family transcriptional regulator [Desulfosporosinus sp. PR]